MSTVKRMDGINQNVIIGMMNTVTVIVKGRITVVAVSSNRSKKKS